MLHSHGVAHKGVLFYVVFGGQAEDIRPKESRPAVCVGIGFVIGVGWSV